MSEVFFNSLKPYGDALELAHGMQLKELAFDSEWSCRGRQGPVSCEPRLEAADAELRESRGDAPPPHHVRDELSAESVTYVVFYAFNSQHI